MAETNEEKGFRLQRILDHFRRKRDLKLADWERNDIAFHEEAIQHEVKTMERKVGHQVTTR